MGAISINRQLSNEVRKLTLEHLRDLLLNPDSNRELYNQVLPRLATSALPRITEIGGDPDNKTPIPIYGNISLNSSDEVKVNA